MRLALLTLLILIFAVGSAGAATLEGYFNKTYAYAKGTSQTITLDSNLTSVNGASVEFVHAGYSREITITNPNNALTDYQISFTLDTASLISAGKMRSDCGDIRITDSDQSTLLPYWIEGGTCNTNSTRIWVKVPSIPASSTKKIYLFYGNLSATSLSNGDAVFEFFDDFEGTELDTTKWATYGRVSVSVSNSKLSISAPGYPGYPYGGVKTKTTFPSRNVIFEVYRIHNSGSELITYLTDYDATSNPWYTKEWYRDNTLGTNNYKVYRYTDTDGSRITLYSESMAYKVWRVYTIAIDSTNIRFLVDNVQKYAETCEFETTDTIYLHIGVWNKGNGLVDWVRVRKYVSQEPSVSVGKEEQNTGATVNPRLELNGYLVQYSGNLTEDNLSSGKIAINPGYFIAGNNILNFSADSDNFNATIEFNYTYSVSQTEQITPDFQSMWVNLSTFYLPNGTQTASATISFNTSGLNLSTFYLPNGTPVYSYSLKIYVNDQLWSNFTHQSYEDEGIKYITVSVYNLTAGNVSIAVQAIFSSTVVNVAIYDEISKSLLKRTLNISILDPNYNLLASTTTATGQATINILYYGSAYLKVWNADYFRQIKIELLPNQPVNATVYFPTSNVLNIVFEVVDRTGAFANAELIVKKYVNRNVLSVMYIDKLDAERRVSTYLIANEKYSLHITNGIEERILGWYTPYIPTIVRLVISDLKIDDYFEKWITVDFTPDPNTKTISASYNATKEIDFASFTVYDSNKTIAYYAESYSKTGSFTFLTGNDSYTVILHVESADGDKFEQTFFVNWKEEAGKIEFLTDLPPWIRTLICVGICLILLLIFGNYRADIATVLSAAMFAMMYFMGWIPVSYFVVLLAAFIAFSAVVTYQRREVKR